jgi:Amt family ammonium transporter
MTPFNYDLLNSPAYWSNNFTNSTKFTVNPGDTGFLVLCTALVMLMAPGLAQFYGGIEEDEFILGCLHLGMVKVKNMINTMMLSAICMGVLFAFIVNASFVSEQVGLITIQWVVFGYTFTFGGGNQVYGSFQYVGLRDVGLTPNPGEFQCLFSLINTAT